VRARALVVRDVGSKHPPEMSLIEDDDVVQTLATDGPDDPFDVGILPGRAWRGADGCQAERFGRAAERRVEGRVTVVEEESRGDVVWEGLGRTNEWRASVGCAGRQPTAAAEPGSREPECGVGSRERSGAEQRG
jgi:hypothetical protein